MDQKSLNPDDPQAIHAQMEHTREALTEKLEALNEKLHQKVDATFHTAQDTIHRVKETVEDTVHGIKRAFDLKHQVRKHPWTMVGLSLIAGMIASKWTMAPTNGHDRHSSDEAERIDPRSESPSPTTFRSARASKSSQWKVMFQEELQKAQAIALGVALGAARDWLSQRMPSAAANIQKMMDNLTKKVGGEPVEPSADVNSDNGHGGGFN